MKGDNKKTCRWCGERILITAIKCKNCGDYQEDKYKYKGVIVKPGLFQKVFCTHCHSEGKGKTVTNGSIFLELILWCFMITPGLIYSGYRSKSKHCVCAKCGSDKINKV